MFRQHKEIMTFKWYCFWFYALYMHVCACVCTFGIWFLVSISNINQSFELLVLLLLLLLLLLCVFVCFFSLSPSCVSLGFVSTGFFCLSFGIHVLCAGALLLFLLFLFHSLLSSISTLFLMNLACFFHSSNINAILWTRHVELPPFAPLCCWFFRFSLFLSRSLALFACLFVCNFFFLLLVLFGQMLMI